MILEWFQLSLVDLILLASLLLVFFVQLFYYLYYYRGVLRKSRRMSMTKEVTGTGNPPVSIIICARNQAEALEQNLPAILSQDYPEFQVVVVNDASSDHTGDVLVRLEQDHPNLYHTFVPPGVQSVSAKKVAMTIGIKAAKYDVLLLTEANCVPNGNRWISSMMQHFNAGCDIVLGYSSYASVKGLLKNMVAYDTLFTALQFMGFAQTGKPYMAYGQNMAYRKDLFFKNRGFASHLNLKSGEDDLFLEEIATPTNTSIEVSPESKILANTSEIWSNWKEQKSNHLATSSFYRFGTRFKTGLELFSRFLFYTILVASLVFGILQLNVFMLALAGTLFIIRYAVQLSVVNGGARCFDEHRFYISLPVYDVIIPIINCWFRIGRIFNRNSSYTWRVLH